MQVGSPETLELLLVLDHKSPFEEQQLHFRFRCFRHHGEWFEFRNEVRDFVTEKLLNPSPTPNDDESLVIERDKDGKIKTSFQFALHDNRKAHNPESYDTDENCRFPQTLMRSLGYGVSPIWNSTSDSHDFWHEVSTWRR